MFTPGVQNPKGGKMGGKMDILSKKLIFCAKRFFKIIEPNEREFNKRL